MPVHYLLRRRKLGKTSAREIMRKSNTGIRCFRNDNLRPGRFHEFKVSTNAYHRSDLPSDPGFVFRWGCLTNVPGNPTIVNTSAAIHKVNDKGSFRKLCAENNLAPKTWLPGDEEPSGTDYPLVLRRNQHAQGRHFHVCNNPHELAIAKAKYPNNWYASKLVNKTEEYRVFIVSGRVVWVAKKTPGNPNQVAWNVAQGGRFDNVNWSQWPLKAIKYSMKAFDLSGLDFGGIDVMIDSSGTPHVLEINSAPSQTSPYRQECVAKAFDYIVQHGKQKIPLVEGLGDWKKWAHPALSSEVLVV